MRATDIRHRIAAGRYVLVSWLHSYKHMVWSGLVFCLHRDTCLTDDLARKLMRPSR